MCSNRNLFFDLNENFRQKVKLGNNTCMDVLGKGNVRLKINGLTHVITEVFFVPELKTNILSIDQLQQRGLSILIQHGNLKNVCAASKSDVSKVILPLHIHT